MRRIFFISVLAVMSLTSRAEYRWLGDLDNDNELTTADVQALRDIILGKIEKPKDITVIDVNQDKKVDISDLTVLIGMLIGKTDKIKVFIPNTVPIGDEKGDFD